jgi:hypothetical protein
MKRIKQCCIYIHLRVSATVGQFQGENYIHLGRYSRLYIIGYTKEMSVYICIYMNMLRFTVAICVAILKTFLCKYF